MVRKVDVIPVIESAIDNGGVDVPVGGDCGGEEEEDTHKEGGEGESEFRGDMHCG